MVTDSGPDRTQGIAQTLSQLCGTEISEKDYLGYFLNEYGEELIFVQRRGEKTGTLWHSDMDWEAYHVSDYSIKIGRELDGVITVGDLIINRPEATWLSACLAASRHLRRD